MVTILYVIEMMEGFKSKVSYVNNNTSTVLRVYDYSAFMEIILPLSGQQHSLCERTCHKLIRQKSHCLI